MSRPSTNLPAKGGLGNTAKQYKAFNLLKPKISTHHTSNFHLLQHLPSIILVIKKDSNCIVFANHAALAFLGKNEAAVTSHPLTAIMPQVSELALQKVYDTAEIIYQKEIKIMPASGGTTPTIFADIQLAPIAGEDGLLTEKILITLTDVTAQVTARQLTDDKDFYFRQLADTAPEIIFLWRNDGYCIYKNTQWYQYTGLTADQSEGFSWLNAVDIKSRPTVQQTLFKAIKDQTSLKIVFQLRRHDGEYRWFQEAVTPRFNASGKVEGYIGSITDINEHKTAKVLLRDAEERLRLAIDATGLATFDVDLQDHTVIGTPRLAEIFGFEKKAMHQTIKQTDFLRRFYPSDKPILQKALKEAYKTGAYTFEARIVLPTNKLCWIKVMSKIFFDADRKPLRLLGMLEDITRRKQLEQHKDEFIGIVSHELKTPVTALKVYTQLLNDQLSSLHVSGSADMLAKMDGQVGRLTTLIKDLLDTARLDNGELQVKQEVFCLSEVIKQSVEELQMMSAQHLISHESLPFLYIQGDKERTRQVITNLLNNSIKYSAGAAQINISTRREDNHVICAIQDFGVGIPATHLEDIFKKYYRINDNNGSTFPGLGLGLFIAQQIIRLQGGDIWAESAEGKGSSFWFSLPLHGAI